jgi:hypothetical protein
VRPRRHPSPGPPGAGSRCTTCAQTPHGCTPQLQWRARNCCFLLPVAHPSSIIPVIMCVIIDLILVLTPMPMPNRVFPSAFSEPKTSRGGVLSASLLRLRSRLPPCSAVLLRVPSAEARCARAWPRVGVPVRLPVGLPLPPALVRARAPRALPSRPAGPCSLPRAQKEVAHVPNGHRGWRENGGLLEISSCPSMRQCVLHTLLPRMLEIFKGPLLEIS